MTTWVKIDRVTGASLGSIKADEMERTLDKVVVWLPLNINVKPTFNSKTHKLIESTTQPDLSDTSVSVTSDAAITKSWTAVALTNQEKAHINDSAVSTTDHSMANLTEKLLVAIATGQPLVRDTFPAKVWNVINDRRAIRGKEPV